MIKLIKLQNTKTKESRLFNKTNFKKLLNNGGNKTEVVVSFLAILELVKQRTIEVDQIEMFDEIEIRKLGAKD